MLAPAQARICFSSAMCRHSAKERKGKTNLSQKWLKNYDYDFMRDMHKHIIRECNQFNCTRFCNAVTKSFCCFRSPYGSLREIKTCKKARFVLLTTWFKLYIWLNYTFLKATSDRWYPIINQMSCQIPDSAVLLLMLRTAVIQCTSLGPALYFSQTHFAHKIPLLFI